MRKQIERFVRNTIHPSVEKYVKDVIVNVTSDDDDRKFYDIYTVTIIYTSDFDEIDEDFGEEDAVIQKMIMRELFLHRGLNVVIKTEVAQDG